MKARGNKIGAAWLIVALAAVAATAQAPPVEPAVPLTLSQAVSVALEKNPLRKAAMAQQRMAAAGVKEARSAFVPRLNFTETATRGNDPVYVFGTRLRQNRFTAADFALNRLNNPVPVGNFATRLGGSWTLFDSFSNKLNFERAQKMQGAAGNQLERTDQEIIFRVVEAYYGLLRAAKQQQVVEQAVETAQSILDRSQARFESGVSVESDLLRARVDLSSRRQQLVESRNGVSLAQAQLSNSLGLITATEYEPAEALAERTLPAPVLTEAEAQSLVARPDLKRLLSQQAAQEKSVAAAKAAFGPKVNVFGGWELDNPAFTGGGGNNWVGGVELQLDLFQGGAKTARLEQERAAGDQIAALRQAAENQVRLEVRRAWYDLDSARQQVEIARASSAQAQESLRISQNRYDAGLATLTDLLSIEEASRRAQSDYWEAVYRLQVSYANLELAEGTLSAQSAVVTP